MHFPGGHASFSKVKIQDHEQSNQNSSMDENGILQISFKHLSLEMEDLRIKGQIVHSKSMLA